MFTFWITAAGAYWWKGLVWGLVSWAVVISVLAVVVFGWTSLMRTAAQRSLIWTGFFFFLALAPLVEWFTPKPIRFHLESVSQSTLKVLQVKENPNHLPPEFLDTGRSGIPHLVPAETGKERPLPGGFQAFWMVIPVLWMGGFLFMSILLWRSWWASHSLQRFAMPLPQGPLRQRILRLAGELGIRRAIVIKLTDEVDAPATLGAFPPVLLLPRQEAPDYAGPELEPALLHELAHISRGDYLRNLVMQAAASLWWFLPWIWFCGKRFREDIELACDDVAIVRSGNARAFADMLGELALNAYGRCPSCSLCLFESKRTLLVRVKSALQNTARAESTAWIHRLLAASVCFLFLAGFGMTRVERGGEAGETMPRKLVAREGQYVFPDQVSWGLLQRWSDSASAWRGWTRARGTLPDSDPNRLRLLLSPNVLTRVGRLVASRPPVRHLSLSGQEFSPSHLQHLSHWPGLASLDLSATALDDTYLESLAGFKDLNTLILSKTRVSSEGLDLLRKMLPGVKLHLESYSIHSLRRQSEKQKIDWPRIWRVFGPFPDEDGLKDSAQTLAVPKSLTVGDRKVDGKDLAVGENQWLNLEGAFGEMGEGLHAWVFAELSVEAACSLEIWAAADWWMRWHLDGNLMYDTGTQGNQSTDYAFPNHSFRLPLKKGKHVLAIKVSSGSRGWGLASMAIR